MLSPSPIAVGHAVRQRDDVLHRAAQLAADDVVVGVRPEVRRERRLLHPVSRAPRRRTRRRSRSAAARRSPAPGSARTRPRPGLRRPRRSRVMTSLIRLVVPSSMPFISETRVASRGRRCGGPVGEVAAQRLRRDGEATSSASVERLGRVGGRGDPLRQAARRGSSPGCGRSRGCRRRSPGGGPTASTSRPASARTLAKAVPHDPAPRIATRRISVIPTPSPPFRRRGCVGRAGRRPQRRRLAAADLADEQSAARFMTCRSSRCQRRPVGSAPAQRVRSIGGPATTVTGVRGTSRSLLGPRVEQTLRPPHARSGSPAHR